MKFISAKRAIAAIYFVISADRKITDDELVKFDEFGREFDPENYDQYKEDLISYCKRQLENLFEDDDIGDVFLESIDRVLVFRESDEVIGVTPRLLLWDMFIASFEDGEYSPEERRLIKHVVRVTDTPASVFYEMEQLMQTYIAVNKELEWVKSTDRTYAEVAPVVAELESRVKIITKSAQRLIQDEAYFSDNKTETEELFEEAESDTKPARANVLNTEEIKKNAEKGLELGAEIAKAGLKGTKKFFGGLAELQKSRSKSQTDNQNTEQESEE